MFSSIPKAVLFSFLLSLSSTAVSGQSSDSACTDVHVFMARGNGEAYPGRVGEIANAICGDLGGESCDAENIIFDSSQSYCDQANDGVSSGVTQINAYADRCADTKIVLAGYSLGAQIVGDIVGGGGGTFYTCTENTNSDMPIGSIPGDRISAVLLFGNVRHVADQSYNVGPGSGDNGQYPRSGGQLAGLNQYAGIMQDYCLATDPICALGDDGESHTTYMTVYASQAGAWVAALLSGSIVGPPSSSSAAPSSTSAAASTSSSSSFSAAASTSSSVVESSTSYSYSSAAPSSSSSGSLSSSSTEASSTSSSTVSSSTQSSSSSSSTVSSGSSSSSSSFSSSSSSSSSASTTSIPFSITAVPFVFSNTATVATTSVFLPTTAPSTYIPTTTFSSVASSSKVTSVTSVEPVSTVAAVSSVASHAGAYSNAVGLTMNLVAVVVVKVLVF